jgi:pyrroloquinoline quinone biosynthesis protein D
MMTLRASDVPRLPRGVRLRFDAIRGAHVLLAPERAFNVDATAAAVLELVDGQRTIAQIVDILAGRFDERPEVITGDVVAMLNDLVSKRVVET